ncbi:imidazoleglycerol-phosphate dehydratase [Salmonella enterica subsp. enterica]|uniref:Imidazoleglycerol-phosphate dehydratase n=1 Tax=Salmonella enterica I TaxID=59201 RepID=A0A447U0N7_SALET|nr:imidazoleglycerol-phosphate dehydratase [Salmonella enterica subsp. enterica]
MRMWSATPKKHRLNVSVWLDREGNSKINTGVGFFDHMLDQIATHGGFRMEITVKGDLYIDDHPHGRRYRTGAR